MWLGASSRVALPEMYTDDSLSNVYLPSGVGYFFDVLPMNISRSSWRCQGRRTGILPLVAMNRFTSGPPRKKPLLNGWRVLRTSHSSLPVTEFSIASS